MKLKPVLLTAVVLAAAVAAAESAYEKALNSKLEWPSTYEKYGRGDTGLPLTSYWGYVSLGNDLVKAGSLRPNACGLYDMGGSVWEFCLEFFVTGQDWFATFGGKGYDEPVLDPFVNTGTIGTSHVDRGGAFSSSWSAGRCAARSEANFSYVAAMQGFRLRAPAVAE